MKIYKSDVVILSVLILLTILNNFNGINEAAVVINFFIAICFFGYLATLLFGNIKR